MANYDGNGNGSIIRMSEIRKVYDTGKVKVEALKSIDLDVKKARCWRSSALQAPANRR